MGSKNCPGSFDCYAAADPDEPMFVLLGRDPSAGALVRLWADLRSKDPGEAAKVAEARACATALDDWARSKGKAPRLYVTADPHDSPIRSGMVVRFRDYPGPPLVVRSVRHLAPPRDHELHAKVFWYGEGHEPHEGEFPVDMLQPVKVATSRRCIEGCEGCEAPAPALTFDPAQKKWLCDECRAPGYPRSP